MYEELAGASERITSVSRVNILSRSSAPLLLLPPAVSAGGIMETDESSPATSAHELQKLAVSRSCNRRKSVDDENSKGFKSPVQVAAKSSESPSALAVFMLQ